MIGPRGRAAWFVSGLGLLSAAPAPPATDMAAQLHDAEQRRDANLSRQRAARAQAALATARAQALAAQRVQAAARLRDAEQATEAAADRMADLARQRREAEHSLAQQADNLGPLLPLIERLALYPTETLLAVPQPIGRTLEGLRVLQGITTDMERQAEALRRRQAEVAALTQSMQRAAPALEAAQQKQAAEESALDAQIALARAAATEEDAQAEAAARQAAQEAGRALTLHGMLDALAASHARIRAEARRQAALLAHGHHAGTAAQARAARVLTEPAGPGLAAGVRLSAPVAGTMSGRFGAETDDGPAEGIRFAPPPAARVVSPCSGRVVFAGPFRSYGRLLIVDCGGGYDFVLAGLDRLDASVGRAVRQGEPVGVMPDWDPRAASGRPALYVELRHDGAAIDPVPFLRAGL